jgi:hypothetical protein
MRLSLLLPLTFLGLAGCVVATPAPQPAAVVTPAPTTTYVTPPATYAAPGSTTVIRSP